MVCEVTERDGRSSPLGRGGWEDGKKKSDGKILSKEGAYVQLSAFARKHLLHGQGEGHTRLDFRSPLTYPQAWSALLKPSAYSPVHAELPGVKAPEQAQKKYPRVLLKTILLIFFFFACNSGACRELYGQNSVSENTICILCLCIYIYKYIYIFLKSNFKGFLLPA